MDSDYCMSFFSPNEAQEYIAAHPDTVILDIRTEREYMEQRIKGSLQLDFFQLSPCAAACLLPDKGRAVMVCCRAGIHSRTAAALLRQCGYNAIDIGSLHDWQGQFEGSLI